MVYKPSSAQKPNQAQKELHLFANYYHLLPLFSSLRSDLHPICYIVIYNNSIQMMSLFYSVLGRRSSIEDVLQPQTRIEVRNKPTELVNQLKNGGLAKFIARVNQQPETPLLAVRKLSLIHYILIHFPQLADQFQTICLRIKTSDLWLNQNIIRPYSVYLYKVISESESYRESKLNKTLEISFNLLFYAINMLKDLFPCVKKMSNLSRYYLKVQKQLKSTLTTDYVSMIAYESQELYNCFKAVLGEMITNSSKYITNQAQKVMIKSVIQDQLPRINEEMKNLFLDKYYFPYGKGFGVKLIKEEDLVDKNRQLMQEFNLLHQKGRLKKQKKMTLEKLLFGERGHLNPEVILSLSQIRKDDSRNSSRGTHPRACETERYGGYEEKEEITENV